MRQELTKAETEFQHSQKQYQLEVNKLLLDLDLPLNKKVQFEPIKRTDLNRIYQTEKNG
ncbi:hypothetical protein KHA80_11875 [Anaerobacillus sp. HL2]|nr:hypothetical protein KHA80_11875 [Anaerobacillus sp. HL2]